MKKAFLIFGLATFLCIANVNAESVFYKNEYGVALSEQEYDFFEKMYWKGYSKYVTSETYNYYKELDVFDKEVFSVNDIEIMPLNTSLLEKGRVMNLSKACNSTLCAVNLSVSWNLDPTVKSYDVVGARIENTNLRSVNALNIFGTNYSKVYNNPQIFDNGFGFSIPLPNAENLKISLSFTTGLGGTVYGTYQHAKSNISEVDSKKYTISSSGYGKVFKFSGIATSIYDQMNGVEIEV